MGERKWEKTAGKVVVTMLEHQNELHGLDTSYKDASHLT